MFTRYGYDVLWKYCLLAAVVFFIDINVVSNDPVRYGILSLLLIVTIFVLNFFRDPDRSVPQEDGILVSPADGKVVVIKQTTEPEYLKGDAVQVSVFMSPLDVHVNRFPVNGTVQYFRYVKGEYLVAYDDKSSERNERTHIGVEDGGYKVLFKQIAGAIARRIVAEVTPGQQVNIGERFGMIKFGSRVDILMPKDSAIEVKLNDRVTAGETIIARYRTPVRKPIS